MMTRSRLAGQQLAFALQQAGQGTQVAEVARKIGHQRTDFLSLEEEIRAA